MCALPCLAVESATTERAIVEYTKENYEEALHLLLEAKQTGGASPINEYYTGLCRKEVGDYQEAVKNFTAALAGPQPVKKSAVDLVSALYNLERYDEAMKWVEWSEREGVSPKEISFIKGQLLVKNKQYDEAVASFNKSKTGDEAVDQQVDIQIASAHVQNNKYLEAREALQTVITRNPNTDAATFAREYDQKLSAIKPARHWNLFIGTNYQYDDNILASPYGKTGDSSIGESLRLEYDAQLTSSWTLNAQYSVNNMNNMKYLSKSSLSQSLAITTGYRIGNHVLSLPILSVLTDIDNTYPPSKSELHLRNYSIQNTIRPTDTYIINQTNLFQTSLSYSHRNMLIKDSAIEDNRDANIYSAQAGYIYLFSEGNGMLNLRGEVAYEETRGANGKNLWKKFGADLLLPLTDATRLIISSEVSLQDYDNISTIGAIPPETYPDSWRFNVLRSDTTINASVTINQRITSMVYLNLIYSYIRAISNIYAFDYQRNLVSTGLEVRF